MNGDHMDLTESAIEILVLVVTTSNLILKITSESKISANRIDMRL